MGTATIVDVNTKICIGCQKTKPVSDYNRLKGKPRARCRDCQAVQFQTWRQQNLGRTKANWNRWYLDNKVHCSDTAKARHATNPLVRSKLFKSWFLRTKYGVTPEQYATIWDTQDGRCASCGDLLKTGRGQASLDHNHQTGSIRGILCSRCNVGIGMFLENPTRMLAAIQYLERTDGHCN